MRPLGELEERLVSAIETYWFMDNDLREQGITVMERYREWREAAPEGKSIEEVARELGLEHLIKALTGHQDKFNSDDYTSAAPGEDWDPED